MPTGADIVALATKQLGKPYVWDKPADFSDPNPTEFDCSGLTGFVYYQLFKINITHYVPTQYTSTYLAKRPLADVQIGDIVVWGGTVPTLEHCAIYVGNNQVIQAPQSGENVDYMGLTSWEVPYPNVLYYPGTTGGTVTSPTVKPWATAGNWTSADGTPIADPPDPVTYGTGGTQPQWHGAGKGPGLSENGNSAFPGSDAQVDARRLWIISYIGDSTYSTGSQNWSKMKAPYSANNAAVVNDRYVYIVDNQPLGTSANPDEGIAVPATLPNPLSGLGGLISSVSDLISKLESANFWIRTAEVVIGVGILIVGVTAISKNELTNNLKKAVS